jgi:hypothetical protein
MQKRIGRPKRPTDVNQLAHQLVEESTRERKQEEPIQLSEADVKRFMADMGRRGGKKGGKARAAKLTQEERSSAASKAARARWRKA